MQYSYLPQLNYRHHCKEDSNFLPTNFNNSRAGNSNADVAILIVLADGKKFPILIGDLKAKVQSFAKTGDHLRLLNYMMTVQRPYKVDENGSYLIGFLMDYEEAYIFRFRVGFWTDYLVVPGTCELLLCILYGGVLHCCVS